MPGFALMLAALLVTTGGQTERPPWEWTLKERLDERFDPISIRERDAARLAADPRETSGSPNKTDDIAEISKDRPFEYGIDGRRNPELFLSFELFDALLTGLSPQESTRTSQRQLRQKYLRSLGYDPNVFWGSLEGLSADYLDTQTRMCTDKACADARCVARFQALEAARKLFGRDEFNRLLYLAVAPTLRHATATMDKNYRADLERQELGCR